MTEAGWEFWIDRGGTFTDIVGCRPDGVIVTAKLLSENPEHYADAASAGIAGLMERHGKAPIVAVKMGTTVATNALLERTGEPTLLAITKGHGDALRIGYQSRPRIFARHIVLPEPVYSRVAEIDERVTAEGDILRALDETAAHRLLLEAFADGYRAVAVVLMHGYRYSAHERRVAALARDIGFQQISVSHDVSALIKLVGRGDSTVADAYLSPVLDRYVSGMRRALGEHVPLYFMQSSGGLVSGADFRGKDAVLSGPAGGVVGMVKTAEAAGFDRVIGFDMGGTSTDVSHYAGQYEHTHETLVAGVRMRTPMLSIHTIAAGGGSICRFDGMRLRVGPQSAGAIPGPACYRRGGPLTVTDCNVMLGKLQPSLFPALFGESGDQPLDRDIVREKFEALAGDIEAATARRQTAEEIAEGFLRIAVENMAKAIKQVSIARGHDVTRYTLNCFGGAAGQHACLVADSLGIQQAMIHPQAGVLSAYGIGLAELKTIRERTINLPLAEAQVALTQVVAACAAEGRQALLQQNVDAARIATNVRVDLRYESVDASLSVSYGSAVEMRESFESQHRERFGFAPEGKSLVVETCSVECVGRSAERETVRPARMPSTPRQLAEVRARMGGIEYDTPVYDRDRLSPGCTISGPAILREDNATTVVEPGWKASIDQNSNLILTRIEAMVSRNRASVAVDPMMLEIFNNVFMAVAEEMGLALQNTASSVNIKERLDFSCALFDRNGALIANAPHIPVHLGSMGDSVRTIIDARGGGRDGRGILKGDVYVLNAPYRGGTHLPDVTVIMPVFDDGGALMAYLAARGHHADIGGMTPGSMPPFSTRVEEEGVLIDNFLLVDRGVFREQAVRTLLASSPYPARNPDQNITDLKAQIAACMKGASDLRALNTRYGGDAVQAYMGHVQDNGAECIRRVIAGLGDGSFTVEMDNGAKIAVAITVDRKARCARVDFSGTSVQTGDNYNAPLSVARAAVLYVFRTLVDDDIPLNDGCMRPIELMVPEGSFLHPRYPAAVVAGNVETSQAITDALYGALGLQAAAQGTMNNFTFGDGLHQYYETICGGSGAGNGYCGTSAVHTHMTNTRLTDPEILEVRFPVLVEEFSIRRGSGGGGMFPGGDGVVRKLRFRTALQAAMLANRRRVAPFGLRGGEDGAVGRNWVERADGSVERFGATAAVEMKAGDLFVVETPGGGGFGRVVASNER